MDLTKNFVKAKRPCAQGVRWFLRHHHDGSDYQPLLDPLVRAGRAGESLHAAEDICAGEGYSIYAGLNIQMETWEASAQVSARTRPERLMSGWWVDSC